MDLPEKELKRFLKFLEKEEKPPKEEKSCKNCKHYNEETSGCNLWSASCVNSKTLLDWKPIE